MALIVVLMKPGNAVAMARSQMRWDASSKMVKPGSKPFQVSCMTCKQIKKRYFYNLFCECNIMVCTKILYCFNALLWLEAQRSVRFHFSWHLNIITKYDELIAKIQLGLGTVLASLWEYLEAQFLIEIMFFLGFEIRFGFSLKWSRLWTLSWGRSEPDWQA